MLQESVKKNEKSNSNQVFRRPFGVGVLSLSLLNISSSAENAMESEEKEHNFRLYQCEEKDFYQLHEMLIRKTSGKYSPINGNGNNSYGIGVSMKMLHGELLQARQEQPLLFQGAVITRKIGFPDIIMPGDVRNDLFLVIDKGEFERGGKSTAKNIEVLLSIIDSNTGKPISDCFWASSGEESAKSQFRSVILYHNNSPSWNETIRLNLPIDKFSTSHIRFEFRHCSTREKSEPKLFAFSFARLMENSGSAIENGCHELVSITTIETFYSYLNTC